LGAVVASLGADQATLGFVRPKADGLGTFQDGNSSRWQGRATSPRALINFLANLGFVVKVDASETAVFIVQSTRAEP